MGIWNTHYTLILNLGEPRTIAPQSLKVKLQIMSHIAS